MRGRLGIGIAVCCVALTAACGDRTQVQTPGAAVADTAVVDTIPTFTTLEQGTGTDDGATATTDPSATGPTNASVPDTVPTGGRTWSTEIGSQTTLLLPSPPPPYPMPPQTTLPAELQDAIRVANDVGATDPVPSEVDADAEPVAAEAAVRYAYQHWILLDIDKNLRATLMENGEVNADRIDAQMQAAKGLLTCARIAIESVQFVDAEHAIVPFWMLCGSVISSYFPAEIIGGAVFADGSWRIDRGTICYLAFGAGEDCSGALNNPPTPPAAIQLTAVPGGFGAWSRVNGDAVYDSQGIPVLTGPAASTSAVITLPGFVLWVSTNDPDRSFNVQAEVLKGISGLTPDDMAHVLTTTRFGATDGTPVTVAERPGRIQVDGTQVSLVVIRSDDVVVQVHATGLTEAEVMAIAAAIQAA